MADVLIRGMEMPKGCRSCPFYAYDGDMDYYCLISSDNEPCPLDPLPAGHGELIDKQAFKADIDGFIECMTKVGAVVDGEMLWGKLLDALDNAKPIVPAEGGDEDG